MGYDVQFQLQCPPDGPDNAEVAGRLAEIADRSTPGTPEHESAAGYWAQVLDGSHFCGWHACQKNMARVSAEYPGKLFELELRGDDRDDLWTYYFQDGRVHQAQGQVVYPEFDPDELQDPE